MFLATKLRAYSTNSSIYRKSLEIKIETEFLISIYGSFLWIYFINQSKILISQWTLISISSELLESERYFSKYFIFYTNNYLSHLKSLFIFLFSSQTWIIILVPEPIPVPIATYYPDDDEIRP